MAPCFVGCWARPLATHSTTCTLRICQRHKRVSLSPVSHSHAAVPDVHRQRPRGVHAQGLVPFVGRPDAGRRGRDQAHPAQAERKTHGDASRGGPSTSLHAPGTTSLVPALRRELRDDSGLARRRPVGPARSRATFSRSSTRTRSPTCACYWARRWPCGTTGRACGTASLGCGLSRIRCPASRPMSGASSSGS